MHPGCAGHARISGGKWIYRQQSAAKAIDKYAVVPGLKGARATNTESPARRIAKHKQLVLFRYKHGMLTPPYV